MAASANGSRSSPFCEAGEAFNPQPPSSLLFLLYMPEQECGYLISAESNPHHARICTPPHMLLDCYCYFHEEVGWPGTEANLKPPCNPSPTVLPELLRSTSREEAFRSMAIPSHRKAMAESISSWRELTCPPRRSHLAEIPLRLPYPTCALLKCTPSPRRSW